MTLTFVGSVKDFSQWLHKMTMRLIQSDLYKDDPEYFGKLVNMKQATDYETFKDDFDKEVKIAKIILGRGAEHFEQYVENCYKAGLHLSTSDLGDLWSEYWSKYQGDNMSTE